MKRQIADGAQIEPEQTVQHYTTPSVKYPVIYKNVDAGGQYANVVWQTGAPAAWVGQNNWVPLGVLKST